MRTYNVTVNGFTVHRGDSITSLATRTITVRAHTAVGAKLLAIDEYASDPSISPFLTGVEFVRARLYSRTFADESCIDCGKGLHRQMLNGFPPVGERCYLCHEAYEGGAL